MLLEEQLTLWDADAPNLQPEDTPDYDDDPDPGEVTLTQLLGTLATRTLESPDDIKSATIPIRARFQDGDLSWEWRDLGEISAEELIGALLVQSELLERRILRSWF
ncbi:hypothetical protein [Nakamurella deserti]|uniref:hypothetical protein n=1 Tax=Nakamurella deserti TaxID=2164074 RepID=UPI000DBE17D4|nr:hypothetical protein [Nakamurella deserti]